MKFLCLAYGDEDDWKALSKTQQDELLAQDEALRKRGATIGIVESPTTVQTWRSASPTRPGPYADSKSPLVGFSIVEARDIQEAIQLVSKTPCAMAKGAIDVWPIRS